MSGDIDAIIQKDTIKTGRTITLPGHLWDFIKVEAGKEKRSVNAQFHVIIEGLYEQRGGKGDAKKG